MSFTRRKKLIKIDLIYSLGYLLLMSLKFVYFFIDYISILFLVSLQRQLISFNNHNQNSN